MVCKDDIVTGWSFLPRMTMSVTAHLLEVRLIGVPEPCIIRGLIKYSNEDVDQRLGRGLTMLVNDSLEL